ncbi:MAG: SagB/ThcOx family dehydrogenase [Bacilli bacterium]|nr:SagB/ThcOx family dehydrogenase [Bacilli bacterium]
MKFVERDEMGDEDTDQNLKLTQPPLTKSAMTTNFIDLPNNFNQLPIENDFLKVINKRESHRVYSKMDMSLLELSYLLWTTQGVKSVRGNNYATLRTVPSGGARHGFETYLVVNNITSLKPGIYHYLPLSHQIEYLQENVTPEILTNALLGQSWGVHANVIFFWSIIPYRCEWRYSIYSHRIALVDIGYVSQNLYLASESIGLGTCAIGAYEQAICDNLFQLDGEDEFIILCSPVGTIKKEDKEKELAFYAFLKENE